jgi:formate hydrogenlyase subunit 3/multisubunit Na+/H+ antiporter MnhD subunit
MEFLVLSIFVFILSLSAIIPTYFIVKRKAKKIIRFIPTMGLLVLSIVLSLLSRLEFEPGSWNDLVFILYALIAFYAFFVSLIGTLALNYYFKRK